MKVRRFSAWWPISADRVCLRLSWRSTIHASAQDVIAAQRTVHSAGGDRATALRTVCGSDAFPVVHGTQRPDEVIVAAWPPPKLDRCPDCERILGKRLPAAGAHHWQSLTTVAR